MTLAIPVGYIKSRVLDKIQRERVQKIELIKLLETNQEKLRKAEEDAKTKQLDVERLEKELQAKAEAAAAAKAKVVAKPKPNYSVLGDCNKYRDIIAQYGWNVDTAIAVCNVESRGNPSAANLNDYHSFANCRGSFGLFQINCGHGRVYDPVENIRIAASMWASSGWEPWSFTTCRLYVRCV